MALKTFKSKITALCATLCAATVPFAACTGTGNPPDDDPPPAETEVFDLEYAATLGAVDAEHEISPLIYGEFLEHINGCIYGVIWSELLNDRKFYYPAGEAGLSPWIVSGEAESTEESYSSNGYAAVLKAGASVSQNVNFVKKEYSGYLYAEGNGKIEVDAGGEITEITVDGAFKKYTFGANSQSAGTRAVSFKCVSGEVKLDSLSLMPADNYKGMRRDTLDAMKELGGTIYRWPGGNFVSGYDWKDGVGDIDKRPSLRNQAWFPDRNDVESDKNRLKNMDFYAAIEPNDMGTEEFLAMCDYIGAEPYLAVNTGSGSPQAAADYVNYCNGSVNTEYGAKRAANGRTEPYGIKYWCVGNEMQGDWQIGHVNIDRYTDIHNSFVEAMRAEDSSIIVSGCGDNSSAWTEGMFASCADNLDYIGEHLYCVRDEEYTPSLFITSAVDNFKSRIEAHRALIEKYPAAANVKIAFDEYAYNWNGQPTMSDAIGIASSVNLFIKNCDVVGMANYSDAVFNSKRQTSPGAAYTYDDRVEFSAIGYVLQIYAKHMQSYPMEMTVRQTDKKTNLQYQATASADGKSVAVAIANPSDKTIKISLNGLSGVSFTHAEVTGTGEKMANGFGEQAVKTVYENRQSIILKPLSVNVITYTTK